MDTYLIDWLNFVIPVSRVQDLNLERLLDLLKSLFPDNLPISEGTGRYHYDKGLKYGLINIYFMDIKKAKNRLNRAEILNRGVLVELSGKACRQLEERLEGKEAFTVWLELFKSVLKLNGRVTRLDICRDMLEPVIDHMTVRRKLNKGEYKARFRSVNGSKNVTQHLNMTKNGTENGWTYYLGSREGTTKMFCRYYSKAHELGLMNDDFTIPFYERWEVVLRKEKAHETIKLIIDKKSVGEVFKGIVGDYITFYEGSSVASWWERFLEDAPKIRLEVGQRKLNLIKTINWLEKSVLGTIEGLARISNDLGIDFFELLESRPYKNLKSTERLLQEYDSLSSTQKELLKSRILALKN